MTLSHSILFFAFTFYPVMLRFSRSSSTSFFHTSLGLIFLFVLPNLLLERFLVFGSQSSSTHGPTIVSAMLSLFQIYPVLPLYIAFSA